MALERQAREAAKLAAVAQQDASRNSFLAYREFRDKIGEFKALVILIEGRLKNIVDGKADDLQQQFERLDTLMMALLVRASMKFFFVLSANTVLPLGAREIFVAELRSLYEAHEKLSRPAYVGRLDASLESDLQTAEAILEEIIDKAPSLLQFGM
ncbi:MAG: hypothetical protein P4M00_18620 [Azospirillaceae bacterium]|nr:hypothetical protein [Azospirillaceae bacterium]